MKKVTHKYGLKVLSNVTHVYELDKRNNNTLMVDAIKKEMKNVTVAFSVKEKDTNIAPGHSYLECYLIFYVKMYFTRKAKFVANGFTTPITSVIIYEGVVSRETVRITFTYTELNGLDILSYGIHNAYLQAPISERY